MAAIRFWDVKRSSLECNTISQILMREAHGAVRMRLASKYRKIIARRSLWKVLGGTLPVDSKVQTLGLKYLRLDAGLSTEDHLFVTMYGPSNVPPPNGLSSLFPLRDIS